MGQSLESGTIAISMACVHQILMARPLWFVQLLKKTFPNRRMIALMTRVPGIGRLVDKMVFENDDIIYLPKDSVVAKTIPVGKSLERPAEMVLPSKIVEHFINKANYHWIMNFCICRDASKCKDYPIEYGCLFLGEAAMRINPLLGRRVTKEEALDYVRQCREAGLVHLIGRNKLDAMWLGAQPGEKLLTICNCCPCCCLWKILSNLDSQINAKVKRMPGVEVTVTDKCTGCGLCLEKCFVQTITIQNGKASIGADCKGCGRCADRCPNNAIQVTINDKQFLQKTIDRIESSVDVW